MNWIKVQGAVLPPKIDTESSKKYNYVRKNAHIITIETDEDSTELYEYDELKVNKEDWELYLETEKNAANIDYVAMMTEVELPEEE